MSRYSMRQLIDSGSWFRFECKSVTSSSNIVFRVRFKSFRPVELNEIDNPENIRKFNISEGQLWLLSFSAVNNGKEGFMPWQVQRSFRIIDGDECIFENALDTYLTCASKFARTSGVYRFSGVGGDLLPKMVTEGAALFFLPDEDSPQFSLEPKDGTIMEEL
jgi:hypothetical protein